VGRIIVIIDSFKKYCEASGYEEWRYGSKPEKRVSQRPSTRSGRKKTDGECVENEFRKFQPLDVLGASALSHVSVTFGKYIRLALILSISPQSEELKR